jgi:hypothetical protein
MSERSEPQQNEPQPGYEPPSVEQIDTQDEPAVVAAGQRGSPIG